MVITVRDPTIKYWEFVTSVPFDPTQLQALVAWWSAADLSDGAVSSWADNVGSLTLTQATGANQPVRAATSFNGSPGVTFDGTDDYLEVGATTGLPTGANPSEVWVTAQVDDSEAGKNMLSYGGDSNATSRVVQAGSAEAWRARTGVFSPSGPAGFRTPAIAGGIFAPTSVGFRFNGTDLGTTADTPNTGTTRTRIGASTVNTPSAFMDGVIADILVFGGLLTTRQRQQLEGYFARRYGLTVLPADHPFKTVPP